MLTPQKVLRSFANESVNRELVFNKNASFNDSTVPNFMYEDFQEKETPYQVDRRGKICVDPSG